MQNNELRKEDQKASSEGPKQGGLSWSQPAPTSVQQQSKPPAAQVPPPKGNPLPPRTPVGGPNKSNRRFLGMLAGGILLGFAVGWAWFAFRPATDETALTNQNTGAATSTTATSSGTVGGTAGSGSVGGVGGTGTGGASAGVAIGMPATGVEVATTDYVSTPTPQAPGTRVLLSGVDVSVPTWVVVYDNNNGVRGNALGAALFTPASPNSAVYLTLLRATVAGKTYFVGRNVDNGDGIFSIERDGPVVDTERKPIYQTFEVR